MNVILRGYDGEALLHKDGTPKTKNFKTNSSYKLWEFYQRYQGKPKRRKRRSHRDALPKGKDAVTLANKVAEYAERKQAERDKKHNTEK